MNIEIFTLFSGSSGNSVLLSSGKTKILFDAGRSARAVCSALNGIGADISEISAVFVTHEHTDHVSALEILSKKYHIPIHMTETSARYITGENALSCIIPHETEFSVTVGDITVDSFRTYHDSVSSVGYTAAFSENGSVAEEKFGLMTDTGHYTAEIVDILSGCTHLILESNHDRQMVRESFYPYQVKKRILSEVGHLSNEQCGELLAILSEGKAKKILLSHLSENNNTPDLAMKAAKEALSSVGGEEKISLGIARRNEITRLL